MINNLRLLALLGAIFLMPSLVSMISSDSVLASSVIAAEEKKEPKYKDVKTRKRASVGKTCAKALDRVQGEKGPIGIAGAADEKADVSALWLEARAMLSDIESRKKVCDSAYEQTQVWNMQGYVSYSLDDMKSAILYYKKIVESDGAEEEFRLNTRLTLGQFYAATEQYSLAIDQLEIWAERSFVVGAEQRLMMAQLYHLLERKDEALEMANIGVAEAEAKGLLPKEGFWNIQKVIYYDRDNLPMVSSILEKLVKHYPKWSHWRQLAGMYGSLERDLDQLVATDVVYLNNELKTEGQVLNLAYLYLGAEVPFRAAVVMEKGMSDEIIDRSPKNLETLGQAWLQAKNLPQALKAFEAASKLSDTGELQYRIASIYLDLGQDRKAYHASLKAERKGVGKNTASNYNKMGSALINLHCYKDAVKVFNKSVKAADTKKKKRFPKQWIKFANYEGDRLQKLRDVGATVPSCSKA
jgi:tetratricopeptide (TPR) repeat protein